MHTPRWLVPDHAGIQPRMTDEQGVRTGRRDTMVHDEQVAQAGAASLNKKGRRGR